MPFPGRLEVHQTQLAQLQHRGRRDLIYYYIIPGKLSTFTHPLIPWFSLMVLIKPPVCPYAVTLLPRCRLIFHGIPSMKTIPRIIFINDPQDDSSLRTVCTHALPFRPLNEQESGFLRAPGFPGTFFTSTRRKAPGFRMGMKGGRRTAPDRELARFTEVSYN